MQEAADLYLVIGEKSWGLYDQEMEQSGNSNYSIFNMV
jgi:hypothetical protein